jgi:hypothetical protein
MESAGDDVILLMLWRQNEGGTTKIFSRQAASLHYLTAGFLSSLPLRLSHLPAPNSYSDAMASFYKLTMPYQGYRIIEEV